MATTDCRESRARGASPRCLPRGALLSLYSTYSRGPKLIRGLLQKSTAAALDDVFPVPMTGVGNTSAQLRRVREIVEECAQVARRPAANCPVRALRPPLGAWREAALLPRERIGATGGTLVSIDAKDAPLRSDGAELVCVARCPWTAVLEGRVAEAGTCCFCPARSALGSAGMAQPRLPRYT